MQRKCFISPAPFEVFLFLCCSLAKNLRSHSKPSATHMDKAIVKFLRSQRIQIFICSPANVYRCKRFRGRLPELACLLYLVSYEHSVPASSPAEPRERCSLMMIMMMVMMIGNTNGAKNRATARVLKAYGRERIVF